uniref:Lipoxygenase n=1 Tax=Oryza meridionalis TaxID=40149 RepID=A0A0E0D125_9ORYZ
MEEFPPRSALDPSKFGDQTSTITTDHIERNLDGISVQQALEDNRLYILDHHDHLIPFLDDINKLDDTFVYATRTLLFLTSDGTLRPIAIELSLPAHAASNNDDGIITGAVSKVYTPPPPTHVGGGVEVSLWQLAKAYVVVNDCGWHQLVSHWLNTHAVMEPFVIAANRQLSVVHPVHKLLQPHFRDTLTINALARQTLINAGGIFEKAFFHGHHALAMSAAVYKDTWNFTDQSLPDDLIKRGMAVADASCPGKVRLLVEDYPYAVDGLAVWSAIEQWVSNYCAIYYPTDQHLRDDAEVQAWWKEAREVGHGDIKDRPWWPEMTTVAALAKSCSTIIWITSALHAAVNFSQYPYGGFSPNRPMVSRRPVPERGTAEYAELEQRPDKVLIRTIAGQLRTLLGISLVEVLSRHSGDEVYLGQRDTPEWTSDASAKEAFRRFGDRLVGVEARIAEMNRDPRLRNSVGPARLPYTLLFPNTSDAGGGAAGLTAKGIPNSITI